MTAPPIPQQPPPQGTLPKPDDPTPRNPIQTEVAKFAREYGAKALAGIGVLSAVGVIYSVGYVVSRIDGTEQRINERIDLRAREGNDRMDTRFTDVDRRLGRLENRAWPASRIDAGAPDSMSTRQDAAWYRGTHHYWSGEPTAITQRVRLAGTETDL